MHKLRVAGRGGKKVALLVHTRDGAIVHDRSQLIAEHGVAYPADGQRGEFVGKDQVEQAAGIASLDLDLAQRADVNQAGTLPYRAVLLLDAGLLRLIAGRVVIARPLPIAHVHPDSAQAVVLIVHGRAPHRMMSHAGENAQRHWRSGRPGDRRPHLRDGLPADLGAEMDRSRLAHAALAGALSQLGEPLDQLNVAHAGLDSLLYIMARDIHAQARDRIRRLRRRRRKICLVGAHAGNHRPAHHHQIRLIGSCLGYQSCDMISSPGADHGLDGHARHHLHPRRFKSGRKLRTPCSIADQHCLLAGHDGVAMDHPKHCRRKHHARQIIVGKEKLGLIGAGGDNHAAGAKVQKRLRIGPRMIDLHRAHQVAFIQTETTAVQKCRDQRVRGAAAVRTTASFSSRATCMPSEADARAASTPCWPPPTTTTSKCRYLCS